MVKIISDRLSVKKKYIKRKQYLNLFNFFRVYFLHKSINSSILILKFRYLEVLQQKMTEKQSKIHSLGPRKMSSTGRAFFAATSPNTSNGFYNAKPILPVTTVPQPQIRYLLVQHPQFDTLVKQLTALRSKYDELLVKFEQKSTQESLRANIQEVIESTHNIEAKMSRIVQDANKMAQNSDQKENQPNFEAERVRHEKECLQIIQTVNKATQRIEQLEQKNTKLQREVESQKQWKEALEKENKRLRLMMQNMEREKEEEISHLKSELKQVKAKAETKKVIEEPQVQEQHVPMAQSVGGKKISNLHYLTQNEDHHQTVVQNEVSGFSRLSINGESSRLSKVYQ